MDYYNLYKEENDPLAFQGSTCILLKGNWSSSWVKEYIEDVISCVVCYPILPFRGSARGSSPGRINATAILPSFLLIQRLLSEWLLRGGTRADTVAHHHGNVFCTCYIIIELLLLYIIIYYISYKIIFACICQYTHICEKYAFNF